MKKLLSMLGAVSLAATSSSVAVSCGNNKIPNGKTDVSRYTFELTKLVEHATDKTQTSIQSLVDEAYGEKQMEVKLVYTSLTDHPEQTNPYYTYEVKGLDKKYIGLVVVEINIENKPTAVVKEQVIDVIKGLKDKTFKNEDEIMSALKVQVLNVEFKITKQAEQLLTTAKEKFTITATPIPSKNKTDAMWADYTKETLEIKDIEVIISDETPTT